MAPGDETVLHRRPRDEQGARRQGTTRRPRQRESVRRGILVGMDAPRCHPRRVAFAGATLATSLAACAAVPGPVAAPETPVPYTSFTGSARELFPWVGEHVALLTQTRDHDPATMARLLGALDRAYEFCREGTGRQPMVFLEHEGRLPIAVEPDTCGKGCGMLGATGIELMPDRFEEVYRHMHTSGQLELTPAYELGRNYWFHADALEYHGDDRTGTVAAGWARIVGLWGVRASGHDLAPHQGGSGPEYLAEVRGLVDRYEADAAATWANTLRVGKSVTNPLELGASNLFASFLLRVEESSGRAEFPRRFLRAVDALPSATSTVEAVDNLVVAASRAAGTDLCGTFRERWHFPVSPAADRRVREALSREE